MRYWPDLAGVVRIVIVRQPTFFKVNTEIPMKTYSSPIVTSSDVVVSTLGGSTPAPQEPTGNKMFVRSLGIGFGL
jgi:hypothetical protein